MTRICITGAPGVGKSTMSEILSRQVAQRTQDGIVQVIPIHHTDDLVGVLEWSEASAEVARWLDEPGPWIIEGVSVSRALRKWRDGHPGEPPPVDRMIMLTQPFKAQTRGQIAMGKGIVTVHAEIEAWLAEHGVTTERP